SSAAAMSADWTNPTPRRVWVSASQLSTSDHHQLVADAGDGDVGAVEVGKGFAGHDFVDGAHAVPVRGDVEDPVAGVEDGVDAVGDEHDGGAVLAAARFEAPDRVALGGGVEAEQRFVAEQQFGVADEGLRLADELLLAAGQRADAPVG